MKKKLFQLLFVLLSVIAPQSVKAQYTSYNLKQGLEALQNNDAETTKKFAKLELSHDAKSGYAWTLLSGAYLLDLQEKDIDSLFLSIDNAIKYVPKSDAPGLIKLYKLKASILESAKQNDLVLATYNEALKKFPKSEDLLTARANYYIKVENM